VRAGLGAAAAVSPRRLTEFGRAVRAEGVPVGVGQVMALIHAASLLPATDLYWAGLATLVSRREEIAAYDRVYRLFFAPLGGVPAPPAPAPPPRLRVSAVEGAGLALQVAGELPEAAIASAVETLRRKSFARCTPEELAALARLMSQIRLTAPQRRTRRRRPARSGTPDLRRTLRRTFRTGGDPVDRAWRARRRQRRRMVFVIDVSGSMSSYSRALLVFAHAALRGERRWEAFAFGTRLTRLTRALRTENPDDALRRAADEAPDWDGGTRIGAAIRALIDRGHAGLVRGAVVVICSDGLDVGEPEVLAHQMARLRRLAHTVVWLNPLKEYAGYEPLARGMRAALPYVDLFESAHNLDALERLAAAIGRLR
jgi:uncharacterized protein with von Willebrand factor type A (vWA) domain